MIRTIENVGGRVADRVGRDELKALLRELDEMRRRVVRAIGAAETDAQLETSELIKRETAAHLGIHVDCMRSPCRTERMAWARHVAMVMVQEFTDLKMTETAGLFAKRNHVSVVYGIKRVAERCSVDRVAQKQVDDLRAYLAGLLKIERQNLQNLQNYE